MMFQVLGLIFWPGMSGVANITQFDASAFPTKIAAEVKQFKLKPALRSKASRFAMSFSQFALDAASQAFADAGILPRNKRPIVGGL